MITAQAWTFAVELIAAWRVIAWIGLVGSSGFALLACRDKRWRAAIAWSLAAAALCLCMETPA